MRGISQADLLQRFNMYSLGVGRIVASLKFLHDLHDSPPLLDYINFHVLWRTTNLGRQISDISKKSMQATIYCHYD
jgi:hypothetical protein